MTATLRRKGIIVLACLGLLGGLAAAILWLYLPRSADLVEVRARVLPGLEQELAAAGLELGAPVFLRIFKETHSLEVWLQRGEGFDRFKSYPICNHSGDLGPKLKEGDRQSPEGIYWVRPDQLNPNSSFHLAFNLGFPNAFDRAHGPSGSCRCVPGLPMT